MWWAKLLIQQTFFQIQARVMSYVVRRIEDDKLLELCGDCSLDDGCKNVSAYPDPSEYAGEDVIVTKLRVVHSEEEARSKNLWSLLKGLFQHDTPEYKVMLYQGAESTQPRQSFILHECDCEIVSSEAFRRLDVMLGPLVDDGQVTLTKALLKELVLPEPVKVEHLAHHMVDVVNRNPEAHTEWPKVFNTLFMSACNKNSVDEIDVLASQGATMEHTSKCTGKTPLHVAVSSGSTSVLDHLFFNVMPFADIMANVSDKVKRLTHRKSSLTLHNSINLFDKAGNTPLMLAVQKPSIASCLYLLLGGALPSCMHPYTGDTALHTAARLGNLALVKLLLAFEADVSILNKAGESPLNVAKNDKTRVLLTETIEMRKKSFDTYSSAPPLDPSTVGKADSTFLLSCDGGGMRNILSSHILIAIEARMKQLLPSCSPFPHYFQYFAGTSSGGVTLLGLAYKDFPLTIARSMIFRFITEVFSKPLSVRDKNTTKFLKHVYGEDTLMCDTISPKVMITTTLADRNPPKLYLMRNYDSPEEVQAGLTRDVNLSPDQLKVWEAAYASSAAPTFFPPFRDCFLDGGLMANNPTLDGMVEVIRAVKENGKPLGCVLSIGTGKQLAKPVGNITVFFDDYLGALFRLPETLKGAKSLLELFVSQVTQSDGQEVRRASAWCESLDIPYFRFSPLLKEDVSPAETDLNKYVDLLYLTHMYILENAYKVDHAARVILTNRPAKPVYKEKPHTEHCN